MMRFFVAIGMPETVADSLAELQPSPGPSIRLVECRQMHVTLHYLGNVDAEKVESALGRVNGEAFRLVINGVGHFDTANGSTTLWAGVEKTDGLLALHAGVAEALSSVGFRKEERVYSPHVTLARCSDEVPRATVTSFLEQNKTIAMPAFEIDTFGLYNSSIVNNTPSYAIQKSYRLRPPGDV